MVDRDVALAKVAAIDRCMARIADVRGPRRAALLPVDVDDIVALNLQRAVQAAIDLASHVAAEEGLGLPDSVAATFTLLEAAGMVEPPLAERLRRMVGFRKFAVHEYQAIDPAIVEAIVTHHLGDLLGFAKRIVDRFGITAGA